MKKVLILGAGGIGSYLIEELYHTQKYDKVLWDVDVTIADGDIVEVKQRHYQNFSLEDVGKNKAEVLGERYKFEFIPKRLDKFDGFDLIILCVDNDPTRIQVIKSGLDFIDLRSTGRKYSGIPRMEDNMKYVDETDMGEYSCQEKEDIRLGKIQKGNKIIAMIGIQMLLNNLRGDGNRMIRGVV